MKRVGTVALVGRPNAGKSTLLNHLLQEKVSIVSDRPQTTRHRLVGILSEERGQMVFFDTPGIHRPLHKMNRQMVQRAEEAMRQADAVCLIVDASGSFGAGDAFMLETIRHVSAGRICVLNKVDKVNKQSLLPKIAHYAETGLFDEIVPISALEGDNCDRLTELLWQRMPEGELLYDPELLTIHPERFLAAERIREKVLEVARQELPFATAVVLERWEEADSGGLIRIHASIIVERPGQKAILIGKRGATVKRIGTAARHDLEEFLENRVYLDLHVRVEAGWRENRRLLAEIDAGARS
jgi:GTP-binding protein Era